MYHSITFISEIGDIRNTYREWHLVPSTRPTIAMPPVKTVYVDIPGASGKLDLSESLTKYPLYENRTGSIDFYVLNDYQTDEKSWVSLYQQIAKFAHGKRLKMFLEDDEDHYYEGRFTTTWKSDNSGKWSEVSLEYDLDPYKYWATPMSHEKENSVAAVRWTLDGILYLGSMPVVPKFYVANVGNSGIDITINNEELGIQNLVKKITTGGTYTFYDVILSNMSGTNNLTIDVIGSGFVRMEYRMGDL